MTIRLFHFLSLVVATLVPFSSGAALLLLPAVIVGARQQAHFDKLAWLMIGWLIWLPATLAWSMSPGLSLSQVAVLACLPLGWLAGIALNTHGGLESWLRRVLPWLLSILVVWGLLQGPDTFSAKPQGPFNDPNTYVALLNVLALPVLARYLAADLAVLPAWRRTTQLALLAGVAFMMFLTASRGATLALVLVLPFLIWLARTQPAFGRKLLLLTVVAVVAYVAALAASGGESSVVQRLVNSVEGGDPLRIMLMLSSWGMIQDHPWWGTGLGSFRLLYPSYRFPGEAATAGGWVHNDYLQLWQEAGLPMLLLLLGVAVWVAWAGWRSLRQGGREALLRMGYLAGIGAILLQALANFMFFFALVCMLVGLYLARAAATLSPNTSTPMEKQGPETDRAKRLAAWGYATVLGCLLLGQVAVEVLLVEARSVRQALQKVKVGYPQYEVAYWVSVIAPFHPTPQQIMGLELADGYVMTGARNRQMRDDALIRMDAAWRRAPCYLPHANDALNLILQGDLDEGLRNWGDIFVTRSLACNARHGLSYYYAGMLNLPHSEVDALEWWHAGLAASLKLGDRLLLATAILSREIPRHKQELTTLARRMEGSLRSLEANPGIYPDRSFWDEAQHALRRINETRTFELVPPPISK